MTLRASTTNLTASSTITASTEDASYPRTNLRVPEEPDNPAKTTVTTDSWWVIDHGSAKSVAAWGLLYANFTSVKVQANATDSWGAPSYDSGTLTIGTNPGNGRLCLFHRPGSAQNFRYNRIFIPSQTPTVVPGQVSSSDRFRLGAVWACSALTSPPRDILWDPDVEEVEPLEDVFTLSERRQRLDLGASLFRLSGRVQAATGAVPMLADEIASWHTFERAWKNADIALVSFSDDHAFWTCVMRDLSPIRWKPHAGLSERDFEWEEVAG
jgi:hypothetical protein